MLVLLLIRFSGGTSSKALPSPAKLFKKRWRVFLKKRTHKSCAVSARTLFRLRGERSTAACTLATCSWLSRVRMGLRPRPWVSCKASIPPFCQRLSQSYIVIKWTLNILANWAQVYLWWLSNILWQRLRKRWLLPVLYPCPKAVCSVSVNFSTYLFFRLIVRR